TEMCGSVKPRWSKRTRAELAKRAKIKRSKRRNVRAGCVPTVVVGLRPDLPGVAGTRKDGATYSSSGSDVSSCPHPRAFARDLPRFAGEVTRLHSRAPAPAAVRSGPPGT